MITLWWESETTARAPEGGDVVDMTLERLDLDVLDKEQLETRVKVTSHPIEGGAPISDYTIREQGSVSLDIAVSDSPTRVSTIEGSSTGDGGIIQAPEDVVHTAEVLDQLRALAAAGQELDVEGLRIPLEGWVISGISAPRVADSPGLLLARIELVEVLTATTEEVSAPAPRVERARRRRDRGEQQGDSTDDDAPGASSEHRTSALAQLVDFVGGSS